MISVIVPAYNAERTLGACLCALNQQTIPHDQYEVIVVDDASTDGTVAVAKQAGAKVTQQVHSGPAAARNLGVREARGEIVLFTDADCEPLSDWIDQMLIPFADPRVVGVKGAYRSRQREPLARLVQTEFEDKYARMRQRETIDFVDTYSAAYRREVFLQLGGFNETFSTASVEDVELSFRLAERGARLVFAPQAQVWHIHATSLMRYMNRKARYGYWRALVYRWHPQKIGGDSHTDPVLKIQFALVALGGVGAIAALLEVRLLGVMLLAGCALVATTLPFAVRVWRRDHLVALIAPPVHTIRAVVQAIALAIGFFVHGVLRRNQATGKLRKASGS
jgi:glycosyltransferase involved in cell wall biosynthesis